MTINETAVKGYSDPAAYVRGRPGYPPEAAIWLRETLALGPGKTALEIGAGTGKFLPMLLDTAAEVIALEPVPAMRAELERAFPVKTLGGSAEDIAMPDNSVDAVICAQAFHWFATGRAVAEMRRVLKLGGMLGLIWNGRDTRVAWVAEMARIIDAHQGDTPRYYSGRWRAVFPFEGLQSVDERHAVNIHRGPAEQVIVERALSTSFIAALPKEQRAAVVSQLRALIARTPELSSREEVGVPYDTLMIAFRKVAD